MIRLNPPYDRSPRRDFAHLVPLEGPPRAFRIAPSVKVGKAEFFRRYAELFELGPEDTLEPYKEGVDISGYSYTKFVQRYRGVLVAGAEFILSHKNEVFAGIGRVVPHLDLSTQAHISDSEALQKAVGAINARTDSSAASIRLTAESHTNLVIASEGNRGTIESYRLAYRCILRTSTTSGQYIVDIDGHSGQVLNLFSEFRGAWIAASATGTTLYDGGVSFTAETDNSSGISRLRNLYTVTLNADSLATSDSSVDFSGNNGMFTDPATLPGVSVHWAAERVYGYYFKTFKRLGIDNSDSSLTQYVNWGFEEFPAAGYEYSEWSGHRIYYRQLAVPYVSLEIVGHEFTHGVIKTSVGFYPFNGLSADGEGRALAESFAHIFGTLVEFATPFTNPDWTMLEDVQPDSTKQRHLDNPKLGNQPDTYGGQFWVDPSNFGSWYTNNSVPNHWFYFLSEGSGGTHSNDIGNSYEVDGIGKKKPVRSLTSR